MAGRKTDLERAQLRLFEAARELARVEMAQQLKQLWGTPQVYQKKKAPVAHKRAMGPSKKHSKA